ncbi:MAG: UbiA family prenyltransferase [Rubrivivax sp.]|jgi:4-hydroxybenzoate polyprenyltransferase
MSTPATHHLPLVVDLDGTLVATDTLFEAALRLMKRAPWMLFPLLLWCIRGRSVLKQKVAQLQPLDASSLPYREDVLAWLNHEFQTGRRLILATAADRRVAQRVFDHLKIFSDLLASDGKINLKGPQKLQAIQQLVGGNFVYAGDSRADMPIWKAANAAVLVAASASVSQAVRSGTVVEREFQGPPGTWKTFAKAIRVHQWVKNVLLFVPALTSFAFDGTRLSVLLLAFLAFSLTASATYIVNDLWDLENDRAHPTKRNRPFASGALSIPAGAFVALLCLAGGIALATMVGRGFLVCLLVYLVATSLYSWVLKTYVLLDVLSLALLYTLRILAGSVALGVSTTPWLLAFSMFTFLSLALVKRCAELVTMQENGRTSARGRDYRVSDLTVLWPMGVGAALASVVVFGLFISTADTQARYATPSLLWLVTTALIYWLSRLWVKTARGEMHDDPVVYALKDRGSRWTVMGMLLMTIAARTVPLPALQ